MSIDRDAVGEILKRLFDPVQQAERALALEEYERTRTDPWKWYCRKCGETGEADDPEARTLAAWDHVEHCSWGVGRVKASDSHGRLMHVWSYTPMGGIEL